MHHQVLVCLLISWWRPADTQFRGFRSRTSTSDASNNHDLLKQIVDHTPEEESSLPASFSGRRPSNILDRAKFRPSFGSVNRGSSTRQRFKPSFPRFGSTNVDVVTKDEDDCSEVQTENELLKKLVNKLQRQVEDLKNKLRQV